MQNTVKEMGLVWIGGLAGLLSAGCCPCPLDHAANVQFMQKVGNTSITVFPASVRCGAEQSYDNGAAASIAGFLRSADIAVATVSESRVPVTGSWCTPWHKMVRQSARSLARYVKANPIDTSYALLPVYWIGDSGTPQGVRGYIVDARGRLAWAVIETVRPHQQIFAEANPQGIEECTAVVIDMLDRSIREHVPKEPSKPR